MVQPNAPVDIYQLHFLPLLKTNQTIWRRLHVRSDSSIATLHCLLQIAFDWSDFHLHRFVIRGKEYALAGAQSTIEAWGREEVPPVENDGILTAEDVSTLDL